MFLMRDWSNPNDHAYGLEGGKNYINDELMISDGQSNDLKSVREFVHSSFQEISCFLMPYPGEFIREKDYNGRWFEMKDPFKSKLFEFVQSLLMPSSLVVKNINNNKLTAKQLNDFMKSYFEIFKSDELLKVETVYEVTARTQLNELLSNCMEQYKSLVNMQILNYSTPNFNESLENNQQLFKNYTLSTYKSSNKMGTGEQKKTFYEQLNDMMEKEYENWSKQELVNQKTYQDIINRNQKAIDDRESSCRMIEQSYQQTLKKLDDKENENDNFEKETKYSNKKLIKYKTNVEMLKAQLFKTNSVQ